MSIKKRLTSIFAPIFSTPSNHSAEAMCPKVSGVDNRKGARVMETRLLASELVEPPPKKTTEPRTTTSEQFTDSSNKKPLSSGILSDTDLLAIVKENPRFIVPFTPELIRFKKSSFLDEPRKIISYGLSSFGYDMSLGSEVCIFKKSWRETIVGWFKHRPLDPKGFTKKYMKQLKIFTDDLGAEYVILPSKGFALGHTNETLNMPDNILAQCIGKSTYARAGISLIVTPMEPGWCGVVTLEIINSNPWPVKLYINEGISQFNFFRNPEGCSVSYATRDGKYQHQVGITLPKV